MDWHLAGLVIFGLLNVVDLILTNAVIRFGGKEFNPIIKFLYSKSGVTGIALFKLLILALFTFQYSVDSLDLYIIWYFDFSYTVLLTIMYFDIRKAKAPIFPKTA